MVSVYGRGKEKKDKRFTDAYIISLVLGACVAVVAIVGIKGLGFLIKMLIEYWLWVLVFMFAIMFIKRLRRKKRLEEGMIRSFDGGGGG